MARVTRRSLRAILARRRERMSWLLQAWDFALTVEEPRGAVYMAIRQVRDHVRQLERAAVRSDDRQLLDIAAFAWRLAVNLDARRVSAEQYLRGREDA